MQATDHCGLYIHIPFCMNRCAYCAFVSFPFDVEKVEGYVQALIREMGLWSCGGQGEISSAGLLFDSIYLGGGTPSLLRVSQIERLLDACFQGFAIESVPEITVEVNPGSCTRRWLNDILHLGVNRLSLGMQSFSDHELKRLGRSHDVASVFRTFNDVRDVGFRNISVDLIAGFPGHCISSFEQSIEAVVRLAPEHISVYLFELKEGSTIDHLIETGQADAPDDDLGADLYKLCCQFLTTNSYLQYEISNFGHEGFECRHNMKYWEDNDYLGVGAGAHGMIGDCRYRNTGDLDAYVESITVGKLPLDQANRMRRFDRFRDAMIMGTRLVKGVDLGSLSRKYHVDAHAFVAETLSGLENTDLFELHGDIFRLTERGRLLSNQVFSRWV